MEKEVRKGNQGRQPRHCHLGFTFQKIHLTFYPLQEAMFLKLHSQFHLFWDKQIFNLHELSRVNILKKKKRTKLNNCGKECLFCGQDERERVSRGPFGAHLDSCPCLGSIQKQIPNAVLYFPCRSLLGPLRRRGPFQGAGQGQAPWSQAQVLILLSSMMLSASILPPLKWNSSAFIWD